MRKTDTKGCAIEAEDLCWFYVEARAVCSAPVVCLLFRKGGFGVPNRFSFTTDQISALATLFALTPPPRGFGGKESSSYKSGM